MLDQPSVVEVQVGSDLLLEEVQDGASVSYEIRAIPKYSRLLLSTVNPLHLKRFVTRKLDTSHPAILTVYTIFAAFSAYFSIYGISTALFAATFDGVKVFGGLDLKVAFSISQMLGYAISKVAGAIIIPTIKRNARLPTLVLLAVLAELPLVLFGLLGASGQVVMVFLSGVPMAWMWGIMVMYLEGRRTSEFLLMGLYLSVMVASGAAKSIAAAVLKAGISESWMPALCGAFSALAFIFFIFLLDATPDPSPEDLKVRSERRTMTQAEARRFLIRWAPGLIMVTLVYSLLGAYRNFRDYFAPELWRDLEGPNFDPAVFTQSELPVGICTAAAYSLLYWIKDNKKAFFSILGVMFCGGAVILLATVLQTGGLVGPLAWMIMVGVGLFMAYIPPGAMLYDRFNGATAITLFYYVDILGYVDTQQHLLFSSIAILVMPIYVTLISSILFHMLLHLYAWAVVAAIYFFFTMRHLTPTASTEHVEIKLEENGEAKEGEMRETGEMEDQSVIMEELDLSAQPVSA